MWFDMYNICRIVSHTVITILTVFLARDVYISLNDDAQHLLAAKYSWTSRPNIWIVGRWCCATDMYSTRRQNARSNVPTQHCRLSALHFGFLFGCV